MKQGCLDGLKIILNYIIPRFIKMMQKLRVEALVPMLLMGILGLQIQFSGRMSQMM